MLIWPSIASQPPSASTADLAERGDRLQRRLVPRLEAHGADPGAVEAARPRRSRPASSRSSWPKPLTTRTPLTASSTTPATSPARCSESHCAGNMTRRRRNDTNSSAGTIASTMSVRERRQHEHHDQRQHEQHDVAGRQREEAEQGLDEGEVGAGARHDLAGGELVVMGEVEALDPFEDGRCADRAARRRRTVRRRNGGCTRARSSPRRGRRAARGAARAPAVCVDDHVVDDRALDERDQDRDHRSCPSETPNAMNTLRLCRARNGQRRRIQPPFALTLSLTGRPVPRGVAHAVRRGRRGVRRDAARRHRGRRPG